MLDSRVGTGHLDLVSARHDTHVGMLVLKALYILVVHPVKGRCIEGVQ